MSKGARDGTLGGRERGKKLKRKYRREAIFQRWTDERVLKRRGLTLVQYQQLCDAGEIEGLGPEDFLGPEKQA